MHENCRRMFETFALPWCFAGRVLEVGPSRGNTLLRDLLPAAVEYHYADVRNFDIGPGRVPMKNGLKIEADDGSFDAVFAAQVIEHVPRPWLWVPELARVSRRAVILICPVSYKYHPGPLDCWRIWQDGMRVLLEDAGLTVQVALHDSLDGVHTDSIGVGTKP